MTRCWLVRHGEPVQSVLHLCYGSLDVELSAAGRTQMHQTAEHLKAEPITVVYTSPLIRAAESARIVAAATQCPMKVVPGLREIAFGDFEGLPYDEIAARHPDIYRQWMNTPTEVRFPNGESFSDMRTRVLSAFARIQREHEDQTIAIVSHGGVNRVLLAWALNMPSDCLFRLAQDHGAMSLIEITAGVAGVRLMNQAPSIQRRISDRETAPAC